MGATFDPSGLYRFNAVMDWLASIGLDARDAHARAVAMQAAFVPAANALGIPGLRADDLLAPLSQPDRGNFLAYDSPHAPALHATLHAAGIITDVRGSTLRVGFGLYHDLADVPAIVGRIADALKPRCAPAAGAARPAA